MYWQRGLGCVGVSIDVDCWVVSIVAGGICHCGGSFVAGGGYFALAFLCCFGGYSVEGDILLDAGRWRSIVTSRGLLFLGRSIVDGGVLYLLGWCILFLGGESIVAGRSIVDGGICCCWWGLVSLTNFIQIT